MTRLLDYLFASMNNMKRFLWIIIILLPLIGSAAEAIPEYIPLEPLPGLGAPGEPIDFGTYISKVFELVIALAAVATVVQIFLGGFMYLSTDAIMKKEEGKEKIKNALTGLFLALSAFIILNTINPNTLNFTLTIDKFGPPKAGSDQIQCAVNPCALSTACGDPNLYTCVVKPYPACTKSCVDKTSPTNPGTKVSCAGSGCNAQYKTGDPWPSDEQERRQLPGIEFNNNGRTCKTVGESACTSVYNIGGAAIFGLNILKGDCGGCKITITGGSEFWAHATHGPGQNIVDLRYIQGDLLDVYIRKQQFLGKNNGCINSYNGWKVNGSIYVLETKNPIHWHVCY
jgi:hypothetical protein